MEQTKYCQKQGCILGERLVLYMLKNGKDGKIFQFITNLFSVYELIIIVFFDYPCRKKNYQLFEITYFTDEMKNRN